MAFDKLKKMLGDTDTEETSVDEESFYTVEENKEKTA